MNLSQAIMHLYPQAVPLIDFTAQDDGPTPVLRDGVDGHTRYTIRPLEPDETEELEGIHYRYAIDYNRLTLGVDYDIVERGPYIAAWNLPEPQPSEADLLAAWEDLQALPQQPEQETPEQRIELLEADNAGLALELAQAQITINQQEQAQADLLFTLVMGGAL